MNNKEPKKDCPVSEYYILNNILRTIDLKSVHSYSHVHISSDEVFSKILKEPFIVQK